MGKRAGRKKTRKFKIMAAKGRRPATEKPVELPPLTEEGKRIAQGVAPLSKIEEIRKA
jgi:hypothetical protein